MVLAAKEHERAAKRRAFVEAEAAREAAIEEEARQARKRAHHTLLALFGSSNHQTIRFDVPWVCALPI